MCEKRKEEVNEQRSILMVMMIVRGMCGGGDTLISVALRRDQFGMKTIALVASSSLSEKKGWVGGWGETVVAYVMGRLCWQV